MAATSLPVEHESGRGRGIDPRRYRQITVVAVVALAAIIVTGASVRLTGSGLGCSTWPTCEEGQFHPPLEFHALVEFINRLITGLVSAAVAAAVLGSRRRRPVRADLTRWSWALVAGVVAQIIIGAFVTLSELTYSVVALHFLVSMVLVWAAMVLWELAGRADDDRRPRRWPTATRVLVGLATAVLVTGSIVTSTGPHAGARTLDGEDFAAERLPFDLGQTVRVHSVTVWLLVATTVLVAVRLRRSPDAEARRRSVHLLVGLVGQGAIGYAQWFSGVPALLVGFHVAGATLVWVLALRLAFATAVVGDEAAAAEPAPVAVRGA